MVKTVTVGKMAKTSSGVIGKIESINNSFANLKYYCPRRHAEILQTYHVSILTSVEDDFTIKDEVLVISKPNIEFQIINATMIAGVFKYTVRSSNGLCILRDVEAYLMRHVDDCLFVKLANEFLEVIDIRKHDVTAKTKLGGVRYIQMKNAEIYKSDKKTRHHIPIELYSKVKIGAYHMEAYKEAIVTGVVSGKINLCVLPSMSKYYGVPKTLVTLVNNCIKENRELINKDIITRSKRAVIKKKTLKEKYEDFKNSKKAIEIEKIK